MRAANAGLEEVASLLTGAEAAMEQRQADTRRKQAAAHKTARRACVVGICASHSLNSRTCALAALRLTCHAGARAQVGKNLANKMKKVEERITDIQKARAHAAALRCPALCGSSSCGAWPADNVRHLCATHGQASDGSAQVKAVIEHLLATM